MKDDAKQIEMINCGCWCSAIHLRPMGPAVVPACGKPLRSVKIICGSQRTPGRTNPVQTTKLQAGSLVRPEEHWLRSTSGKIRIVNVNRHHVHRLREIGTFRRRL